MSFPESQYDDIGEFLVDYSGEVQKAFSELDSDNLRKASQMLVEAYLNRRSVYSCGNGGSAAISNHLVCDHSKGIRTLTGALHKNFSLSSNIELITAISNDIDFDDVFSYQLESVAEKDDVLVTISSSGDSDNIIKVLKSAKRLDVKTIALTGFSGGRAIGLADCSLHVNARNYGVIEDVHQSLMHILAQFIRQSMMNKNDIGDQKF